MSDEEREQPKSVIIDGRPWVSGDEHKELADRFDNLLKASATAWVSWMSNDGMVKQEMERLRLVIRDG